MSLLRKAVQDANGVALLLNESLGSQANNLWRSLFETDVLCQYIGERLSNDHLTCRYVIHSIIRPTILLQDEFNDTCLQLKKPVHYGSSEVEGQKQIYKCVFENEFGKRGRDYEWTLKPKHRTFHDIAKATNCDMLFYRIANNAVHPTFGETAIVTALRLPLPLVPPLPIDITHNAGELSLEFQTVKSLSNTTRRVSDYAPLPVYLQDSIKTLKELAESVMRDLLQEAVCRK